MRGFESIQQRKEFRLSTSSARERFIGVWRLVSIRQQTGDLPEADDPAFGSDPQGRLLYTASGEVSVHFMRSERLFWGLEESPTDLERAHAGAGYGAYAGRYTVDEERGFVLHHVAVALIPNRVGRDLKRFFTFSGDELTLRPPPLVREGRELRRALIWRRV